MVGGAGNELNAVRLLEDVEGGPLGAPDEARLRKALSTHWTWPRLERHCACARTLGLAPPGTGPEPGNALLVSVNPTSHCASLWLLVDACADAGAAGDACLVEEALVTARRAELLARRELPIVPVVGGAPASWKARLLATDAQLGDDYLRGRSFDLSLCLATASRLLGMPLETTVCATGEVGLDGRVARVADVAHKVSLVARMALGVTTMLVPKANEEEAVPVARALRPDLRIQPVETLSQAMAHALPDLQARAATQARQSWHDPEEARRAADTLFRTTLRGHPFFIEWEGVARAASLLAECAPDAETQRQAEVATAIARRHNGEEAPLPWPPDEWLARQRRPLRLCLLAHVVQAAADAGDPTTGATARRALAHVAADGDEHPEDLRLLGAVGRALAAVQDYSAALTCLRRALTAWFELGYVPDASYAVCEALRVQGLLGDQAAVLELCDGPARRVRDELAAGGQIHQALFAQVAMTRALVQVGEPAMALENDRLWSEADYGAAPVHLRAQRGRWRARALVAVGEVAAARALREELAAVLGEYPQARENLDLIELDVALEENRDTGPVIERLRQREAAYRFLDQDGQSPLERARAFADRCRY
jgi:hypothetical protein